MDVYMPAFGFRDHLHGIRAAAHIFKDRGFPESVEPLFDLNDTGARVAGNEWLGQGYEFRELRLLAASLYVASAFNEHISRADRTNAQSAFVEDVPHGMTFLAAREDFFLVTGAKFRGDFWQ
jgi:hypothetical protein